MQKKQYSRLAKRTRETLEIQIWVKEFIKTIKDYIQNKELNISKADAYQKGKIARVKSKIVVYKNNEEHIWVFSFFEKDNLTLADKYNGKCSVYTQKPLDPMNKIDCDCISLDEFLVSELINQHVNKFQLEKIQFQIT